ncbi:MAG: radical SAM protein [Halobacteriota archaeon]|nr:radical SAM protein [Halobacteriota archaeon]
MTSKVLLVNPPWYRFFGKEFSAQPIGLCYIAGVLREGGYYVSVYNPDYNSKRQGEAILGDVFNAETHGKYSEILKDRDHSLWKEIESVIISHTPDIVGISAMTGQYGSALSIAKIVKDHDPDVPVVMGGIHPTALPEEVVEKEEVDIVVRGEGEYTFLELVENIDGDLSSVLGITYKLQDKIVHNADRPLIRNLDELPFPARDLILEKETYPSSAFGKMIGSRGCPHKCIFCSPDKIWNRKVRFRSPESVIDEIKDVQKEFGTTLFYFDDADFTLNKKFVMRVCDLIIEEGLNITWSCEGRADELEDDMAKKMARAGCESICIGVESGDEEILKKMNKGITIEEIIDARNILKKNNILFYAFFMIGFPWEDKSQVVKTSSFMRWLDPDIASFNIATPYPGTGLYEQCKSEGTVPTDWENFLHQSPEMSLNKRIKRDEASQLIQYAYELFGAYNKRKRAESLIDLMKDRQHHSLFR